MQYVLFQFFYPFISIDRVIHSVLLSRRGEVSLGLCQNPRTLLSVFPPLPSLATCSSCPFQKGLYQWNLALNFSIMAESAEALLDLYEYKMCPRMLLMARAP